MTNEKRCLLAGVCALAGDEKECTSICPAFIGMHGVSGKGGRVGSAGIPLEYRLVTMSNSPARKNQTEAYNKLAKYVKTFDRMFDEVETAKDKIKGFYLFSEETGTGKTTTACALLNEWLIRHYTLSIKEGKQPDPMPAFFLDVNEWQNLYNGFTRPGISQDQQELSSTTYYRDMQRAKIAKFLVLDDIGVRSATESFRADLHSVINYRVTNRLVTVYTSNIGMKELMDVYGKRLYDRARDLTETILFTGNSNRGRRI
jgi:DNA replication protein DnaC